MYRQVAAAFGLLTTCLLLTACTASNSGGEPPPSAEASAPAVVAPSPAEPEFRFGATKVVSLVTKSELTLKTRFDLKSLQAALPGYRIEARGPIEDFDAFAVSRSGTTYLHIAGTLASGEIRTIADVSGAVDDKGFPVGTPLTKVYPDGLASCDGGIETVCTAPAGGGLVYAIGGPESCPIEVQPPPAQTRVLDCLRIAGFTLTAQ